jgi:hypothetical protein
VVAFVAATASACSSSSSGGASDAADDALRDATADRSTHGGDSGHDSGTEASLADATFDVPVTAVALVRLANWSPDARGVDFCLATHGTSSWSGPILAQELDGGTRAALGRVTVIEAGLPFDAGTPLADAGVDAAVDATVDAPNDAGDAGIDAGQAGASDAADATAVPDAGVPSGVLFPGMSPYVSIAPGEYDVRVVASGSTDCTMPLVPDAYDLPVFRAGVTETLALVGDTVDQGADPSAMLVALSDDTTVSSSRVALRFVDAVPSVIEVTFASGTIATATSQPYISAAQFGSVGVDTDAGALDSNDYLAGAPISNAVWSLINANGGTTTLVSIEGASIPAGDLATVVAVGGESGPNQNAIGILLCTDRPPVVAGETAACELFEAADDPVCPSCP